MATTTPNYGWPVPTSTDLVKDGATAIEALGDAVDATVFGLGVSGAWTSYTPTFTNLTVGNGTINAKYKQIGKTVVVRFAFTMGSTSSMGTNPNFTFPVAASSYLANAALGDMYIEDNGVAGYMGRFKWIAGPLCAMELYGAGATYLNFGSITSSVPFTWGTGDYIAGQFYYEAA
jgi:hypothetical protein